MYPALNEIHSEIRNSVRKLVQAEISPITLDAELGQADLRRVFERFGDAGYLCAHFPKEAGGPGADLRSTVIIAEEIGRVSSGIGSALMVHSTVGTQALLDFGTEAQKQHYLAPAIAGKKIAAFALTEPNVGSDARNIETRASPVKDGYLLNGSKVFISNGTIAEFYTVVARIEGDRARPAESDGLGLFLVDRGTPGFTVVRAIPTLGNRACKVAELSFQDCFVSVSHRLGPATGAWPILRRNLGYGRVIVAARAVGLAQASFDLCLEYVNTRKQFGRKLADFQMTKAKLADMYVRLEATRLMTYNAAWLADNDLPYHTQASTAKLHASETAVDLSGQAVQILGAYGYSEEYPAARLMRDAKVMTIGEGTSEIQRLIIANSIGC
jgi:alkylation response protein AidB-like acyl-CoA dehydrogenase